MSSFINTLEKLSPIITILISSLVSYFVAEIKVKNEINKTLLTFEYKDKQTFNSTFADLIKKTERVCRCGCDKDIYDAVEVTSKFFTLAPKEFHPTLTQLHKAIINVNITEIKKLQEDLLQMCSNKH